MNRDGRLHSVSLTARELPADLIGTIFCAVGLSLLSVLPGIDSTTRTALAAPLAVFLSGYALLAALFPDRNIGYPMGDRSNWPGQWSGVPDRPDDQPVSSNHGLSPARRIALSFCLSPIVSFLVVSALGVLFKGMRPVPFVLSLSAITASGSLAALIRHNLHSPNVSRFISPDQLRFGLRSPISDSRSRSWRTILTRVALVAVLFVFTASAVYAVGAPPVDDEYTEFYLLTANGTDDLSANDYPATLADGDGRPLVVGVTNHLGRSVEYSIVVELQTVAVQNNSTTVVRERELRRFETTLADGETWTRRHTLTPTTTGERLRVTYLLYRGSPPADPTSENAYRELHLWIRTNN